jgi:protein-disulfide isomerase
MASRTAQRRQREDAQATRLAIHAAEKRAGAWRRRRNAALASVAAAAVVIAFAVAETSGDSSGTAAARTAAANAQFSRNLLAGIPQHGTLLGSPNAPVRVIEYADLQCPYCGEFATAALPSLITRYVRTGEVSLAFQNLSFIGPDSVRAGRVAEAAAQQNKLWNFVELEYLNQGVENSGYVSDAYLHRLLSSIFGLDVAAAERVSRTRASAAALAGATADATANGIDSTPSFLIGLARGPLRLYTPPSLTAAPFASEFNSLLARSR